MPTSQANVDQQKPNSVSVFISHSSADSDFARKIHDDLESFGFDSWIDLSDIPAGSNWQASIQKGLQECDCMVVILSPDSVKSPEVLAEWSFYLLNKKTIFPIILSTCDIPFRLQVLQWINFSSDYESSLKKLIANLELRSIPQRIKTHTAEMLSVRYREKYSREYFLQRKDIYSHLSNFLGSDKTVMVITGKAGTGKSCFICGLEDSLPSQQLLWLQDCARFEIEHESSIDEYIRKSLGLQGNAIDTLTQLAEANPSLVILLVFDAVNEFPRREELLAKLAEFVKKIKPTRIKILMTCRIPIWHSIKSFFTVNVDREFHSAGPNSYVNIDSFSNSELKDVYERYATVYKIPTPFDDLSDQVKQFILQPLFLKLAVEGHEGEQIPETLVLRGVFRKYLIKCLGQKDNGLHVDPFDTPEYSVLQKAIQLMYDHACRELKLALLRRDPEVGQFVGVDIGTPYSHLVDEGLLSQRTDVESLTRTVEMVFVTYERVFEFLLADIIIGPVSEDRILNVLDDAQGRSFAQLRGAAELALAFAIVHNSLTINSVAILARRNRVDSRQFLTDVIHTIHESGNKQLAEDIVQALSRDESLSAKMLAVQAAYQLHLDDRLVNLAISDNSALRDTAALYLYQRWNQARLDGNLDDAYKPIYKIISFINARNPTKGINALATLLSLSVNMMSHLIDDRQSLLPLFSISQDLLRNIPGLALDQRTDGLEGFVRGGITNAFLGVISQAFKSFYLHESFLADPEVMVLFFNNVKNKRAFLDTGNIFWFDNLVGLEDKVSELMNWDHPIVTSAVPGGLAHHVFRSPETHIPLLQKIYETSQFYRVKRDVTYAMIYGALCRRFHNQGFSEEFFQILEDNCVDLWGIAKSIGIFDLAPGDKSLAKTHGVYSVEFQDLKSLIAGLLTIEAIEQQASRARDGSAFISKLIFDSVQELTKKDMEFLLGCIEGVAYQGFPEFAAASILNRDTWPMWSTKARERGVQVLANLRAFYQEEIDSLLTSRGKIGEELWEDIRLVGTNPSTRDVLFASTGFGLISCAVDISVGKALGVLFFEMTEAKSIDNFVALLARVMIDMIFDPELCNIAQAQWGLAHDPNWDHFETMDIPRSVLSIKPDLNKRYKGKAETFIKLSGRGVFFKEH